MAPFPGLNLNQSKFRPPEMPIFADLDLDLPKCLKASGLRAAT